MKEVAQEADVRTLFTLVLLLAVGQTAVAAAGANDSVSPKSANKKQN